MRWYLLIVVSAALLAAIAGCGGSDSSSSSTATVTREAYLKQGDALCKQTTVTLSKELETIAAQYKATHKELDPAAGAEMISKGTVPAMREMAEELAALGYPKGEEAEAEEIVAAFEKGVAEAEADPATAVGKSPFTEASGLAGTFGFTQCSSF